MSHQHSIPKLLLAFFSEADADELAAADMATKWSRTEKACAMAALDLYDRGLIGRYRVSTTRGGYQYVYTRAAQKEAV